MGNYPIENITILAEKIAHVVKLETSAPIAIVSALLGNFDREGRPTNRPFDRPTDGQIRFKGITLPTLKEFCPYRPRSIFFTFTYEE